MVEEDVMSDSELVRVAVFDGKHIRKIIHEGEWWFSVVDIIEVLTGSSIPKRYWSDLKKNSPLKDLLKRTRKSYG